MENGWRKEAEARGVSTTALVAHQAPRAGTANSLGATLYGQFAEDAVDVGFDRTGANDQALRTLVVRETGDNQLQALSLAVAQRLSQMADSRFLMVDFFLGLVIFCRMRNDDVG